MNRNFNKVRLDSGKIVFVPNDEFFILGSIVSGVENVQSLSSLKTAHAATWHTGVVIAFLDNTNQH